MDSIKEVLKTDPDEYYAHCFDQFIAVAVNAIDASGKEYLTKLLENGLNDKNLKIANIHPDPWQNSLFIRLQTGQPTEKFLSKSFSL